MTYVPPYLCLSTNCRMNPEFNKNEDVLKQSFSEMRRRLEKIYEGGGKKAIEKQREKNKLTPRERIDYFLSTF